MRVAHDRVGVAGATPHLRHLGALDLPPCSTSPSACAQALRWGRGRLARATSCAGEPPMLESEERPAGT